MPLNPAANANTLKQRLDQADPNTLADAARAVRFGTILRQAMMVSLRRKNPDSPASNESNPYQLATLNTLSLADDAKANTILRAYARATAAAGTLGEMTVEPYGTTPADAQIAVAPNGDIVFLESSEYTDVDVVYLPEMCDVVELTLPVAANSLAIPAQFANAPSGTVLLMEAESLAGTLVSKLIVTVPASTNAGTGKANLDVAKQHVLFANADAVTQARVKLGICWAVDVDALLEATSTIF